MQNAKDFPLFIFASVKPNGMGKKQSFHFNKLKCRLDKVNSAIKEISLYTVKKTCYLHISTYILISYILPTGIFNSSLVLNIKI